MAGATGEVIAVSAVGVAFGIGLLVFVLGLFAIGTALSRSTTGGNSSTPTDSFQKLPHPRRPRTNMKF